MPVSRSTLSAHDPLPPLDAEPGPAARLTPAREAALVAAIVASAQAAGAPTAGAGPERPRRVFPWLALAAIVMAGSATAATVAIARRPANVPAVAPPSPNRPVAIAPPPRAATAPRPALVTAPSAVATPETRAPAATPTDRLAAANELRRHGRWREAEAAYLDVAARAPAAPEAYVATLAAAALRLEHGSDAAGALRLYQRSAAHGALGVEAAFGVARCHRALGDTTAERAALEAVVARYPTSLQADRARQRLLDLGAPALPAPAPPAPTENAP